MRVRTSGQFVVIRPGKRNEPPLSESSQPRGQRPLGLGEVEATRRETPRPGPVGGYAAGTGWEPRGPSSRVPTRDGADSRTGRAPFT